MDIHDYYTDVANVELQPILQHQKERSIESYAKQFMENRIINPNKDKDIEDIIRVYWSLQDVDTYHEYTINPFQQKAEKLLAANPGLLKKLYKARSYFAKQQYTYTEEVRSILRFGRYPFFTTEYDASVVSMFSDNPVWNEQFGFTAKQVCLLVANDETTFIKSMVAGDDYTYAHGLTKMWRMLSLSNGLTYLDPQSHTHINCLPTYACIDFNRTAASAEVKKHNEKVNDAYSIISGDPFSSTPVDIYSGHLMYTYSGIISRELLIDTRCLSTDHYAVQFKEYLEHPDLQEENRQLYTYMWSRFETVYIKLLRALVDRAIMYIHQYMVDFLISFHEKVYTIPQLCMLYHPGSMILPINKCGIPQPTQVLTSVSVDGDHGLMFFANCLFPNTTKTPGALIHDESDSHTGMNISTYKYFAPLTIAPHRGGTCFKYFTIDNDLPLMVEKDVDTAIETSLRTASIIDTTKVMQMDGIYYTENFEYESRSKSTIKNEYHGRVITDPFPIQSGWSLKDTASVVLDPFSTVVDYYKQHDWKKDHRTLPGMIRITLGMDDDYITAQDCIKDIRILLSLPVMYNAFVLKDKKYAPVSVNDLTPVEFQTIAYDKLILDKEIKDFIYTTVKYHEQNYFRDIISNKQGGSIFLLAGPSSTGKTLTCEAIAEMLHRPLYQVSAGELGTDTYEVDTKLHRILTRAKRWGAIVLIDEADVFLRVRDDGDINRNAIVSVFLRQLEYFNGIMFLTSNYLEKIDPAFNNRILQTFVYKPIDTEHRAEIWKSLCGLQGLELTDKQAKTLAEYTFANGRTIKNIIKAAIAKALSLKSELTYEIVLSTTKTMDIQIQHNAATD